MRIVVIVPLVAAGVLAAAAPGAAQSVQKFYQGREINLIVGFNRGGTYDPYGRVVARHLPRFLPGSPTIRVLNMQGDGSVRAANYLYNTAPKDGSELGLISASAALEPLFRARPTQFEGQRFTWLGSSNDEAGLCISWHASPIATARDLLGRGMSVGASGASNLDFPLALNGVLGTKLRIMRGYDGSSSAMLSMERGEVDGMCGMIYSTLRTAHPDWMAQKRVRTLLQIGLRPNEKLAGVPFVMDFAKNDDDRRLLRLLVGWPTMGRPFVAPPGIPEERKLALRRAFDLTMSDPAFLADAAKLRIDISPVRGATIEQFLQDAYATPRPLVERAGRILAQGQ